MKKLILSLFLLLALVGNAWGATAYNVCQSGCDETAIAPVYSGNALTSDDTIEVQADTPSGSKTYTEKIAIGGADDGTSGHPIVLFPRVGDSITISGSGNTQAITNFGGAYNRIQDFKITGGSSQSYQLGSLAGVEVLSCDFLGGAGYGIFGNELTEAIFKDLTFDSYVSNSLRIGGNDGVATSGLIQNILSTNCTGSGINLSHNNFAGWTIEDIISTLNGAAAFNFSSAASNLTASRLTGSYSVGAAFTIIDASVNLKDSISEYCDGDGPNASSTGTSLIERHISRYNGSIGAATGDAYTAHDASVLNVRFSLGYGNRNSGIAYINTSTGEFYQNSFYNNHFDDGAKTRGTVYVLDTAIVTPVNNIIQNTTYADDNTNGGWCVTIDSFANIPTATNNCYWSDRPKPFKVGVTEYTFSEYVAAGIIANGADFEKDSFFADPLFVNPENGDLKLKDDSPCLDTGIVIPGVNDGGELGIYGNITDETPNFGAYQGFGESTGRPVFLRLGGKGIWIPGAIMLYRIDIQ